MYLLAAARLNGAWSRKHAMPLQPISSNAEVDPHPGPGSCEGRNPWPSTLNPRPKLRSSEHLSLRKPEVQPEAPHDARSFADGVVVFATGIHTEDPVI